MTATVFALLGSAALFLLYGWMLSAIIASYLSGRKGYGEKIGLACGLLLFFIAPIIWLVWPARPESKWKKLGPFGRGDERRGHESGDEARPPAAAAGAE
jgi:hypothetical protein